MRIEVSQKLFPHYQAKKTRKSKFYIFRPKKKQLDVITNIFKQLFLWIGKQKKSNKITHFHEPLKPVQLKSRRVNPHFLDLNPKVNLKFRKL